MTRDDHTLLIAMRRGDQAAAVALWERHGARLVAYAATVVGRGEAEDAVQEALVRAIGAAHVQVAGVRDVPAWLLTLVRHAAINRVRGRRRRRGREAAVARVGVCFAVRERDDVAARVAALPRRLREVVVLRHVCGLTFAQCAVALGANPNTVAGRYREAMGQLRGLMERQESVENKRTPRGVEVAHGYS